MLGAWGRYISYYARDHGQDWEFGAWRAAARVRLVGFCSHKPALQAF